MIILYGISNCDTVRKAKKWLDSQHINYEFHDFRQEGVNPIQLRHWVAELGWETLVNKRSTTWRNLPEESKKNIDETLSLVIMEEQPTLIKRPVLETPKGCMVGFNEAIYQETLC
ncbi:MAG: ArsC family reductase [Thiotrichaceae bacterium]|nr:ArsC family reductase [Thiotrichaceae bacterium]